MIDVAGGIVLFLLGCVAFLFALRVLYVIGWWIREDPGPFLVVGGFIAFASLVLQ